MAQPALQNGSREAATLTRPSWSGAQRPHRCLGRQVGLPLCVTDRLGMKSSVRTGYGSMDPISLQPKLSTTPTLAARLNPYASVLVYWQKVSHTHSRQYVPKQLLQLLRCKVAYYCFWGPVSLHIKKVTARPRWFDNPAGLWPPYGLWHLVLDRQYT